MKPRVELKFCYTGNRDKRWAVTTGLWATNSRTYAQYGLYRPLLIFCHHFFKPFDKSVSWPMHASHMKDTFPLTTINNSEAVSTVTQLFTFKQVSFVKGSCNWSLSFAAKSSALTAEAKKLKFLYQSSTESSVLKRNKTPWTLILISLLNNNHAKNSLKC